jgi:hypothetical protein
MIDTENRESERPVLLQFSAAVDLGWVCSRPTPLLTPLDPAEPALIAGQCSAVRSCDVLETLFWYLYENCQGKDFTWILILISALECDCDQ